MSGFLVSRTAEGYRFLLESDSGRALVRSKDYATLDACKKGICSLVYYAPVAPVVDSAAGAHAPNPKIELTRDAQGFRYAVKSANGKSVICSAPFASRKACLRALSMLRVGVQGAPVLFMQPAGLTPLVVGGLVQDPVPAPAVREKPIAPAALEEQEPLLDEPVPDWSEDAALPDEVIGMASESVAAPLAAPAPAPSTPPPTEVKQPRRVKLGGVDPTARRVSSAPAPKKPLATPQKKPSGVLSRLFKR